MRTPLLLLALTTTLSGCAGLLQGGPDLDVYELRAPDFEATRCGRGRIAQLVVEQPKTRGTLDSERIMIRPSPLQTEYLPDAQWGDTVPVTLQRLLVQGLGSYDVFGHVGRAPLGLAGDYALISEIDDFNAEVAGEETLVRLRVSAQLVREMDASIVSRGSFEVTMPAAGTKTSELVPAFDLAGQELTAQMTDWALRGVGVNPASCR
ncbi:ABC-type transport auxiliary lipoprotein family protein [Paracoccus marinaquae]|uniref:Membrane integrity-associated transporter subunit PqiC n=1 Tax=Paracoccus marinaquae TaxID=2841926 RepID=A0ABS6AFK9_9RHOB|nr:ABC-type transport auxiliary lipoprotein family protein [Paracoccus marinaquae]MBU3028902.1 membrane integrity-associated transporter subunit PqiC [Paracoccus marinaquae]